MQNANQIKIRQIQNLIANEFNITIEKLLSETRKAEIAYARQISMYLCRFNTRATLKEIANLHNRDNHGTVIHASEIIGYDVRKKESLRNAIEKIEQIIKTY